MSQTLRHYLQSAQQALSTRTAWLDAVILLEWATGIRREHLLAELTAPVRSVLTDESMPRFEEALERRSRGVPIAYITGTREFFGRTFAVTPAVLVPRPETETLVETALDAAQRCLNRSPGSIALHDACTGSGCVAVTVAAELADREHVVVSMSDISNDALGIAQQNAVRLLAKPIEAWQSDLMASIPGERSFDVITANAPYLTPSETDSCLAQGWGEPRRALDGGDRGLELMTRLVRDVPRHLKPGGVLLLECAPAQVSAMRALMYEVGFGNVYCIPDLSGAQRVVAGEEFLGGQDVT